MHSLKLKHSTAFTALYILLAVAEMAGEKVYELYQNPVLIFITKPLLMPVLIAWMLVNRPAANGRFHTIILVSLVFSMAGDCFLMLKNDNLFLFGLSAFLIAHILYIIGFANNLKTSPLPLPWGGKIMLALPYLGFVAVFLYILKEHILTNPATKDFFIPVVVYACTIGIMGIFAMYRMSATNKLSFRLILAGALLFIASDSMIAINKFVSPLSNASLLIMSTYIIAQYLIVKGTLCHTQPTLK